MANPPISHPTCTVELDSPEKGCVSPVDPPWLPDTTCMFFYETILFQVPIGRDTVRTNIAAVAASFIEFQITYQHKWCLLGKQHGPLIYTLTLLPGEKVTLYHNERYRTITSTQTRFSVQTTFTQFVSAIQQAKQTNSVSALNDLLVSASSSKSGSDSGGIFGGMFGIGGSSSNSSQSSTSDQSAVALSSVSDKFSQTMVQASMLTEAERSLSVSTYQEKDSLDISTRVFSNLNECRAITYFVRRVVELYAFSTTVSDISYRIVSPNVPAGWHAITDLSWLPATVQKEIKAALLLLPKVGDVVERPTPISIPTDGAVYDPELASCSSCEPQRIAAIELRLEKEKAEALKACYEAKVLELEYERRRLLLDSGDLSPFKAAPVAPAPVPAPPV
ncbi:MAG TPA: hypothetical protein VN829_17950 [Dongiaceae bacterium]|nr:hypothetical protein [Dongiaceae bacterium]